MDMGWYGMIRGVWIKPVWYDKWYHMTCNILMIVGKFSVSAVDRFCLLKRRHIGLGKNVWGAILMLIIRQEIQCSQSLIANINCNYCPNPLVIIRSLQHSSVFRMTGRQQLIYSKWGPQNNWPFIVSHYFWRGIAYITSTLDSLGSAAWNASPFEQCCEISTEIFHCGIEN